MDLYVPLINETWLYSQINKLNEQQLIKALGLQGF